MLRGIFSFRRNRLATIYNKILNLAAFSSQLYLHRVTVEAVLNEHSSLVHQNFLVLKFNRKVVGQTKWNPGRGQQKYVKIPTDSGQLQKRFRRRRLMWNNEKL